MPGRGWSSPVAWKDQVFLTSAISPGKFKEPSTGIFGNDYVAELQSRRACSIDEIIKRVNARDIEASDESGEVRYMVYAFDAATGRVRWEREAHKGVPFGGRHRKNTFASETPATDGERLYVYFGNVGLFAYALDGKPLWSAKFPPQPMYLNFGTASSPVVHDGHVFVLHDNDGDVVRGGRRRAHRQGTVARRPRPAGRPRHVRLVDAVHLEARRTDRARRHRPAARGELQPRRQGTVADGRPHRPVDAEPARGGRAAVRQHRIAGRSRTARSSR